MSQVRVFCEGPDDVSALARIAQDLFGAARSKPLPGASPAERGRTYVLALPHAELRIVAPGQGVSTLSNGLVTELRNLPAQLADDAGRCEKIGVVFDPDDKPAEVFFEQLAAAVASGAAGWSATPVTDVPGAWWLERAALGGARIYLRAIPWCAGGAVLDGLPDRQNLERLVCRVLERTHPELQPLVTSWLEEIARRRTLIGHTVTTGWKAAIHLWAALVGESAFENATFERFLGQYQPCKAHVEAALHEQGVHAALASVLGAGA